MLKFRVQGSGGAIYDVHFAKGEDDARMTCTCNVARRGNCCPHMIELLKGDVRSLLSSNIGDVTRLRELIDGTRLAAAVDALASADIVVADARIERDRWMKAVDRLLRN
jgi:hypothetical protein